MPYYSAYYKDAYNDLPETPGGQDEYMDWDCVVGSPKNCSIQKYSFIIGFSNILSTIPRYTAGLLRQRLPTRICG